MDDSENPSARFSDWITRMGSKMRPPWSQGALDRALIESCSLSRQDESLRLLARGARPAATTSMGSTCLMFAARRDHCDLFLALCEHPMCDTMARDLRGRDALAWASSRKGLLGERAPSNLFERLDEALFDLSCVDAQGRHACQSALESQDESACLFWLCRAPSGHIDQAFETMDAFTKASGAHRRACDWLARSQALALKKTCSAKDPDRHPSSRL